MDEIWKPIDGFEKYEISNLGQVRSKERILKPFTSWNGYLKIKLYNNGSRQEFRINRLVAMYFCPIPSCPTKDEVHHKDHNKQNNVWTNLSWETGKKNKALYLKHKRLTCS